MCALREKGEYYKKAIEHIETGLCVTRGRVFDSVALNYISFLDIRGWNCINTFASIPLHNYSSSAIEDNLAKRYGSIVMD